MRASENPKLIRPVSVYTEAERGTAEDEKVVEGDESRSSGLGQEMATEEAEEEEKQEEEIEEEEGRRGRAMPSPPVVSRKEREEHELTHLPFRSWCPQCI